MLNFAKPFFIRKSRSTFVSTKQGTMKKVEHNLQIGSKLYWSDAPETLAGVVVRFTNKRDVVINFVSGNQLGERNFSIKMAKGFICK